MPLGLGKKRERRDPAEAVVGPPGVLAPQPVRRDGPDFGERREDVGVEDLGATLGPNAPAGMAAMFPDSGSYMVHWHQVDGQWKIASLVVNSMKPVPGLEAMMAAPQQ